MSVIEKDPFDLEENPEKGESKNSILIKKILWYFGAVVVVVITFLGIIQFMVGRGIKTNDVDRKLETIIAVQKEQKIQNDSIFADIKAIKTLVKENTETVEGLSNSYVLFMGNNKSLTQDQFRNYMEGITWESKKKVVTTEVAPVKNEAPKEYKIVVKQIKK